MVITPEMSLKCTQVCVEKGDIPKGNHWFYSRGCHKFELKKQPNILGHLNMK